MPIITGNRFALLHPTTPAPLSMGLDDSPLLPALATTMFVRAKRPKLSLFTDAKAYKLHHINAVLPDHLQISGTTAVNRRPSPTNEAIAPAAKDRKSRFFPRKAATATTYIAAATGSKRLPPVNISVANHRKVDPLVVVSLLF